MKIAAIATSAVPSSTANSIQAMKACQALAQLGHSVTLLLPDLPETRPTDPAERNWDCLSARYGLEQRFTLEWLPTKMRWKRYDLAWKSLDRVRALRADLVYTWAPQAGLLALMQGFPTILEVHDRPTGKAGPLVFQFFLRLPGKKRILPITHALQRYLERDYHFVFPRGQAVVSPNGADLERYTGLPDPSEARRRLKLPEGPTAVYTGHFYSGRGMDLLLGLALHFPQVSFLWVGGTAVDVERWQQKLAQAGAQNVTLTGFVENRRLPLYQAAGEVLLMPYEQAIAGSSGGNSAEICSPMKMFEYMAAGRAIISSDLPVIREVLGEHNAIFCPPEDANAWQAALAGLLADPARGQMLGAQAQLDAARYTWRARAEKALKGFDLRE
jgi:glycosyltransferase involved in cell wall biosynthesis